MNEKLPPEVLIQIFYYLHYEQKQQCKRVCRSWSNATRLSGIDVETLLFKDPADLTTLHNYLTIKPEMKTVIGEHCKRAICSNIHTIFNPAYNFPNLRVLCFFPVTQHVSYRAQITGLSEFYIRLFKNWYRYLETLMMVECSVFIASVLNSGTFCRLKKLVTVLFKNRTQNSFSLLAGELMHAPCLEILHVHHATIHFNDLERVHRNAPRLVSLKLIKCDIAVDQERHKSTIEPAMAIRKFEMYNCSGTMSTLKLMTMYISAKYPCLQVFYYSNEFWEFQSLDISRDIITAVAGFTTTTNTNLCTSIQDQTSTKRNGYTTTLTHSLEELGLDMYFKTNLLLESHLFLNLKSISLTHVPPIAFHIFKKYHKLISLELSFNKCNLFPIEFNTIIRDLPYQLETFGLTFTQIHLDPKTAWTPSNIKWLKFKSSEIHSNLSGYLSTHFLKLNSLSLKYCSSRFGFRLPHHPFVFVDIKTDQCLDLDRRKGGRAQYKCISESHFKHMNTRSREDFFHLHDRTIYPVCKPSMMTMFMDQVFEFSCASVQTILYNGHLII